MSRTFCAFFLPGGWGDPQETVAGSGSPGAGKGKSVGAAPELMSILGRLASGHDGRPIRDNRNVRFCAVRVAWPRAGNFPRRRLPEFSGCRVPEPSAHCRGEQACRKQAGGGKGERLRLGRQCGRRYWRKPQAHSRKSRPVRGLVAVIEFRVSLIHELSLPCWSPHQLRRRDI